MSAISEKVRTALYGKLNVSGVTGLCNGVFHKVAPNGTDFPFVTFDRVPGVTVYALGNNLAGEDDEWLVKAVVDADSSLTYSPDTLAETILQACETAIAGTLSLSGSTCHMARRTRDLPPYIESLTDRTAYHFGFFLRVFSE